MTEETPRKASASEWRQERILTFEEWTEIKRLQNAGKKNCPVAEELGHPQMQVNFAYLTRTYEDYQRAYYRP